jgi:hypothetical protein
MAAIAVWITYFINRQQIATLTSRIEVLRPRVQELFVDDPHKVAFVKREELWYDENRWAIYLPDGAHRLCLATRGIDSQGTASSVKSEFLTAGRHELALEQRREPDAWRVVILCDGKELVAVREPAEWNPDSGSEGGTTYSSSDQMPAGGPIFLFRRRFKRNDATGSSRTPSVPTEGILLWLEKTGEPAGTPAR